MNQEYPLLRRFGKVSLVTAYLSICAIYRDEAPYLREWIEFHGLGGVERFFLYDNLSEDDHLSALAPYLEDGTVVLREWPAFPGQLEAYAHCLDEHASESRWIAFLDLDEFLFAPGPEPVADLLRDYEAFPGVGVNCLTYGDSAHETRPPGLTIESYLRRTTDESRNRIIKSIVDPARVEGPGNNPHYFRYRDWARAVNESFEPIRGPQTDTVSCERLRINHYVTRSRQERERKLAGFVAHTGKPKPAARARERDRLLNELLDESAVRFAPAVRAALAARDSETS